MNTDRLKYRVFNALKNKYVLYLELRINEDGELLYKGVPLDSNYIVEQCTGLKDKNDKLIYAHDVVRTVTGCVGVVEWIPERCGFAVRFPDNTCCVVHETQEIIGNIHEV